MPWCAVAEAKLADAKVANVKMQVLKKLVEPSNLNKPRFSNLTSFLYPYILPKNATQPYIYKPYIDPIYKPRINTANLTTFFVPYKLSLALKFNSLIRSRTCPDLRLHKSKAETSGRR